MFTFQPCMTITFLYVGGGGEEGEGHMEGFCVFSGTYNLQKIHDN